jgi:hypothetical protein
MLIHRRHSYWPGSLMQANICFTSFLLACHMCNQRGKNSKPPLFHTETHTKLCLCVSLPIGKSDHNYILLISAYKQKLKQEVPVTHSIRKWSDDTDATLQDCFASKHWNMFRDLSNGIEEQPFWSSTLGPLRGACLVHSCTPCSPTTAWPSTTPTP